LKKLRNAGIEVITGVLERESMEVNKRFFTFHQKKRPFVILKWAQTKDGFIDKKRTANEAREKITADEADMMIHMWRSQEQAIMVGTHTVIMDNPQLTTRKAEGKSPVRVILDRELKIPGDFHVFDKSAPTLVFTEQKAGGNHGAEYVALTFDANLLPNMLKELYKKDIQSVIVEGGEKLLKSFVEKDLWDEAKVFFSSKKLGAGVPAPGFPFHTSGEIWIGEDTLAFYRNKHNN